MKFENIKPASEYCFFVTDGTHDSPKAQNQGKYLITSRHLFRYNLDFSNANLISDEDYQKIIKRSPVSQWDILFSMIGTVGNLYIEANDHIEYACKNVGIFKMGGNIKKAKWLYYYLQSPKAKEYILGAKRGTTQEYIPLKSLRSLPVEIPDDALRDKITDILWKIDKKIELNNAINENLEKQAEAIFKSWFVDFEPFGGAKPSSWIFESLGNVCYCSLGGTPSRSKPEYWNGNIPWINSGEINNFRIIRPSECITKLGLNKSATKLLSAKTTVIAITGATLGQVSLLEIDTCTNQSVVGVTPSSQLPYEFVYPYIKSNIEKLISHQTGGAQQHINKQNVESLSVIIPPSDIIKSYTNLVRDLYSSISVNCFENEKLSKLRDTLLPKLMSGEIDVSNIKI